MIDMRGPIHFQKPLQFVCSVLSLYSLFELFLLREKCYDIFFQVWPLLNYSDKNMFHCQPVNRRMAKDVVGSYFSHIL